MKKICIVCMALVLSLGSCQNGSKKEIENLKDCCTSDSTMCFKVPSFMYKQKEDTKSILFEGNKKKVQIMKTELPDEWDMYSFAQQMIGDRRGDMTLVSQNDSLLVYEIQKGITHLSAFAFSLHERNGYSVLLTTFGLSEELHIAMGKAIQCKEKECENGKANYSGQYLNIDYPCSWIVDEHPNTQTADVYISQKDHAFGVWLFRFEKDDGVIFKDAIADIANNWREYANVDESVVNINGEEWCKHDIRMSVQGEENRQVSYYLQKGDYIYNIKYGNMAIEVENNLGIIDSMMSSVKLK